MFSSIKLWLSQFYLYVLAGSAALNILLMTGCYIQGLRMHSAKVEYKSEKRSHQNDINNYRQAQKSAEEQAQAAKKEQEAQYDKIKSEGDARYVDLRRRFDAALLRLKASGSPPIHTDLSPQSAPPKGPDGAGQNTVVPTTLSDLEICADNTAKALVAQEWVKNLENIH